MKDFLAHIRIYMFRGLLAIIPLALTFFALQFLYVAIDKKVVKAMGLQFPGLGILFVLISLYLLGAVASNMIGKRIFSFVERITHRIPIIKTIYQVGKQISANLSGSEKQIFKRVVLVEYLKPGIWTLGFVTGTIVDTQHPQEVLLKVFIPTPPNPTSGTMVIVRESQTRDPGCSIDEAIKTVISGGLIGVSEIK